MMWSRVNPTVRYGVLVAALLAVPGCGDAEKPGLFSMCPDPAPLHGEPDSIRTDYIVGLEAGVDAEEETGRLEALCGFEATHIFTGSPGFVSELSTTALECVRCDPVVRNVAYNRTISI
jgi:hypothetical protein